MESGRRLALAVCSLFLLGATGCDLCDNSVTTEAFSQGRVLVARAFKRNCGATTDYSMIVNLQRADETAKPDDEVLLVVKGQHTIALQWTESRALTVTCRTCSRSDIFRQVKILGNVDILYSFDEARMPDADCAMLCWASRL